MNVTSGFHGTNLTAAQLIVRDGFKESENYYDWLGRGVYFWQEGRARATTWAKEKFGDDWAVVEAELDLSSCMDLLDPKWYSLLNDAWNTLVESYRARGEPLPRQEGLIHGMDCEVIDFVVAGAVQNGLDIGSVRAVFQEGKPAFPGSAMFDLSHIQIAIRDLSLIEVIGVASEGTSS